MRFNPLTLLPLSAGLVAAQNSCEVYYQSGTCLSTDECAAAGKTSTPNYCPSDPEGIQCCTDVPHPEIPASNCQPHVIEAGQTILAANEGSTHVVWCYADKSGEHGKGLALDLMVGSYNPKGEELATWIMNNHESLNVMYIIWGQKIWNPSNGEAPTEWANWRDMEDRGSVTANHWDHNHISFNAV
ncbi:hypothetical protein FQN55_007711 [Onygenales sp. PD_40]|nr:hypothetical protein FQN55_007711 [Onygenales sp. PD_40]KAK2789989.1 hypothetical protein FQN52_005799 [Onygenales sp. PD_12]KAK2791012.1 hypothetical protein FQN53_007199 [Emmonsiellopsis sp. PD_33]KAK2796451.1 hypothetical protein FQN51_009340 [Onygenales sp. PD_10]